MANRNGISFPFTDNVYNGVFQGATESAIAFYDNTGWDMDANPTFNITHTLNAQEFREISVMSMMITSDVSPTIFETNLDANTATGTSGGVLDTNTLNVTLFRNLGGQYDNINYDSVVAPRGQSTIWYRNA